MEVTEIYETYRGDKGVYMVKYSSILQDGRFEVHAADELDAFKRAMHKLKEREMNERITIVGITIMVLSALAAMTYACATPSFRETCIAAGKTYVDQTRGSENVAIVEACL